MSESSCKFPHLSKQHWKTFFYHLLEICIMNASVMHKWISVDNRTKLLTTNGFHDKVVLEIIKDFTSNGSSQILVEDFTIRHGSTPNCCAGEA